VVVDLGGIPLKYDKVSVFSDLVAKQVSRIELDVPRAEGRGWQRSGAVLDQTQHPDLDESWRRDLTEGAQHLLTETWVPANDPHYDSKMCSQTCLFRTHCKHCTHMLWADTTPARWPCAHPYGSGSLLSEPGSGGTQRFARNRLGLLDSFFRRSSLWAFWSLDRLVKTELFFKHKRRQEQTRPNLPAANDPDAIRRLFGTASPADIPESTAWWKRQQRDLLTLCADEELGLMQARMER
jgi:hypothetical protein